MSYNAYTRKLSSETVDDRPRGSRRTRRSQILAKSSNLDLPPPQRRTSAGSKSPARNRKSKLIETMAANFERRKTDNVNSSSSSSSVPAQRVPISNGDVIPTTPKDTPVAAETQKVEVNSSSPPETKKSGPSARRGKIQREKRMLRQKRRSTGVVNPKDINKDGEDKKDDNTEKGFKDETDANTQSNELTPNSAYTSGSRVSLTNTEVTSSKSNASNGSHESTTSISTTRVSYTSSSRALGNQAHNSSNSKGNQAEMDELRTKLEAAEVTISKLRKEIKVMDNELHVLEEENHQLKTSNKMLEEENKAMLRFVRGSQSNRT
ncbi:uncharacterized protein LOC143452635 isoform X3 [Clavelina lepadiformis]|uniref:uncharacterized protein LOC143452635 isoform X3 n=1 Tax=Clavelina lepadiformis TaxID=159417 RepID=UPI0040433A25